MIEEEKPKTHSFSIYLIKVDKTKDKKDYILNTVLRLREQLKEIIPSQKGNSPSYSGIKLPQSSRFFIVKAQPKGLWWKDYFSIKQEQYQLREEALLFLDTGERLFAFTFGHTAHFLNNESYEYDFGLITTLNSLDPKKLSSIDTAMPENARKQRTQSSLHRELTFFDFDHNSNLLRNIKGKVWKHLEPIFSNITGTTSVRVSSKHSSKELPKLCNELLKLYKCDLYKKNFPNLRSITPIKDPTLLKKLNKKLIDAIQQDEENLFLSFPNITDPLDDSHFKFSGAGGKENLYDNLDIESYKTYLEANKCKLNDEKITKKHKVITVNKDGNQRGEQYSVFKALIYDTQIQNDDPHTYHLYDGNWYKIDRDYIAKLSKVLDPLCQETTLINYAHNNENDYNEDCAKADNTIICLDKKLISLKGESAIEFCDLFKKEGGTLIFHHVKRHTKSAPLSHLFNQGINSIELLIRNKQARKQFRELLNKPKNKIKLDDNFTDQNLKVIYQIITSKDPSKKSLNLPLFSRISLFNIMERLKMLRIEGFFCFVKESNLQNKDPITKVADKIKINTE
ncbi:DUF6119 family protein [Entomobacter blattae]|uniref:Sporadically distributed protein, TIGR04141 family n=1 Tax=Entomobacter blattae TaxID=2762277 RepID=A0A7H1NTQ6_9PROT|nr:TIGR04141 family sporadically distributed protein [Entomobacter blattae]QNT79166.1 hypothetical protein JGUZn3_19540 [Entomobacter blattae]